MCTMTVPASPAEALEKLEKSVGYLADLDAASLSAEVLAQLLLGMERADSVWTVAWARSPGAFDAKNGHQGDGQKTLRTWLVHMARLTQRAGRQVPGNPGAERPARAAAGRAPCQGPDQVRRAAAG